jgi:hypothetical protein
VCGMHPLHGHRRVEVEIAHHGPISPSRR